MLNHPSHYNLAMNPFPLCFGLHYLEDISVSGCAGTISRDCTEEMSTMFTTATETSGLLGQHWSAGWDIPASQLLTFALVHINLTGLTVDYSDCSFEWEYMMLLLVFCQVLLNGLSSKKKGTLEPLHNMFWMCSCFSAPPLWSEMEWLCDSVVVEH